VKKRRNKLSQKKKLRTLIQKKKKISEMADEAGKDWKAALVKNSNKLAKLPVPILLSVFLDFSMKKM